MTISDEVSARAFVAGLPGADLAAMARLDRLAALLSEENARQNLVAAASLPHLWQRHIADSAQLTAHVPRETDGLWLDLGTGAGFPGIVSAVLQPDRPVWMVESRRRRVDWLESVVVALGLSNARVIGQRLEMVEPATAAIISARAFAPLDRLLALSARFSTAQTLWLLPKGRQASDEVAALRGWQHDLRVTPSCTDPDSGIIIGHLDGHAHNSSIRRPT